MEEQTVQPISVHIITVGADARELSRTEILVREIQPLSSRICATLDELNVVEFAQDAYTILRLFGRANCQVLTWLGSKGRVATEVAVLGFADAVLIEPGQPARAIGVLPQAFISAIAAQKPSYDLSGAAFIIGANEETKVIAASLSRLGFKRLMIVDTEDRKTEQVCQYLRRRLFGIEIEAVLRRTLTQVPNEAAIAISLVDTHDTGMLEDLSYLNFLRKGGVWIDWIGSTVELKMTGEIKDAGAYIFDPTSIRAWREAHLLNSVPKLLATAGQKPEYIASRLSASWKNSESEPSDPS